MDIPKVGDALTIADFEMILEAITQRNKNFPDEPGAMTMAIVMLNIGNRFTPVSCVNGEWSGVKQDIPRGEGVPKCPDGHVLTEGPQVTLGWVSDVYKQQVTYTHNMPEPASTDRMHEFSTDCWCEPEIEDTIVIHKETRRHMKAPEN